MPKNSANGGACRIMLPWQSATMLAPSKIIPSFPPTRFTKTMGRLAAFARWDTIAHLWPILPLLKGDALMETKTLAPISINSSAGSFVYSRSLQKVLSFQKSSQTVTPSSHLSIGKRRRSRPGSKYRGSSKTSYSGNRVLSAKPRSFSSRIIAAEL